MKHNDLNTLGRQNMIPFATLGSWGAIQLFCIENRQLLSKPHLLGWKDSPLTLLLLVSNLVSIVFDASLL